MTNSLIPEPVNFSHAGELPGVRAPGTSPRRPDYFDLIILGAGPAGLMAAECAIRRGANVLLIERHRLGGNSLNVGSVPSKVLVHAAQTAHTIREFAKLHGKEQNTPEVSFSGAMNEFRRIRERINGYHSLERLRRSGIEVRFGFARFVAPDAIEVDGARLLFGKALIATGARPEPSKIPGLDKVPHRTSTDIFDLKERPARLAVIGGGPLGCEIAQAMSRLGTHVIILQNDPKFLPREERDAAELLSRAMARDGVEIWLNSEVVGARLKEGVKTLDVISGAEKNIVTADEILLSIGRIANVEELGLEHANVAFDTNNGIQVDEFLRSSNPNIYAAGDVCLRNKFANVARASAYIAVENALHNANHRHDDMLIPWCTFCSPEIAHIGMQVWQAREKSIPVTTYTVLMHDVDRAIIDEQDDGFVKIHVRQGTDEILGATIVAARASDMINEIAVAMNSGIGMKKLARMLHTYPSQSDAIRMAALACFRALADAS